MKLDIGKMIKIQSSVGKDIQDNKTFLFFNHFMSGYKRKKGKKLIALKQMEMVWFSSFWVEAI